MVERKYLKPEKKLVVYRLILQWLIIWIGMLYIGCAFIVWDMNMANWSQAVRGVMLFLVCCYALIVPSLTKEIRKVNESV